MGAWVVLVVVEAVAGALPSAAVRVAACAVARGRTRKAGTGNGGTSCSVSQCTIRGIVDNSSRRPKRLNRALERVRWAVGPEAAEAVCPAAAVAAGLEAVRREAGAVAVVAGAVAVVMAAASAACLVMVTMEVVETAAAMAVGAKAGVMAMDQIYTGVGSSNQDQGHDQQGRHTRRTVSPARGGLLACVS